MTEYLYEESLELFQAIINQSEKGIALTDSDGKYVFVNEAFCVMTGYSSSELTQMQVNDLMISQPELMSFSGITKHQSTAREVKLLKKDGSLLWSEIKVSSVTIKGREFILGTVDNITESKEKYIALHESEEKFRIAFKTSPDAVNLNRLHDGVYVDINESFTHIMGYRAEEIIGKSSVELNIWKNQKEREDLVAQLSKNGYIENLKAEFIAKDGVIKTGLMSARIIEISGEKLILSITRDMTEYKQAEEVMALMGFAMDHVSEAVYLIDKTGKIAYINSESCRSLGYSKEEMLDMSVYDLGPKLPKKRWIAHWKELQEKGVLKFTTRHCRKDGRTIPVEITANYFEYDNAEYNIALVSDITEKLRAEEERNQLEEQMIQTQKLESLGVLAGGIAHDFNNLLAAIMGHAELTKRRLLPESPAIENLKQIEKAAERAADLAKQMLAYSGKGKFVTEILDINNLLEEMLHMIEVSISKNIVLRLNPYLLLPSINADATQIRQIVMNLVINAAEAIGEKSGVISISTGCMHCDEKYLKNIWLEENLRGGLYVYLEVADTGIGMAKETLSKLFDPFFTTKFTGRGLGMSAVMGIVRGHKGALKVYSEVGKGTTFKILLPASEKPAEVFNADRDKDSWVGSGKILLVDDEETVRGIGVEMLKELGFDPLTANDGKEALEVFKNNPDISLVILDMTMPKMGGEQCYRELKLLNPDIRVIISSGYSEYEISQKFIGKGVSGFVQKPYTFSVLQKTIKNLSSTSMLEN
ncbi:PAS domain S-box-containing protein [Desulfuromusa kysingii]|uniref:histidine kinase n=1 Tax=Desulfuromusa kysingii TaxID=37625 RepID=A0A1H3XQC7_9BACT|nr:PAS domain-containing sensor histidine kinase [Desulfuromusa kysingii]SEA00794.1 PAS domain S-box-containing protein [Desulfuromusa kysingii]